MRRSSSAPARGSPAGDPPPHAETQKASAARMLPAARRDPVGLTQRSWRVYLREFKSDLRSLPMANETVSSAGMRIGSPVCG